MSQTSRKLNMQSVRSIMNKRTAVPVSLKGKRARFIIQGDGTTVDVVDGKGNQVLSTNAGEEGTVLQKRIFNLKAASQLALNNPRNRAWLADGVKAEKAGDVDAAHELFTKFLNATQVTFSSILNNSITSRLANGVEIAATVQQIDTENGSLLTIDPSTISVMEPEVLDSMDFDIDSFLPEEVEEKAAPAKKAKARA